MELPVFWDGMTLMIVIVTVYGFIMVILFWTVRHILSVAETPSNLIDNKDSMYVMLL